MKVLKQTFSGLFILIGIFLVTGVAAQTLNVKGVVRDDSDASTLPGVNIIVKGTTRGTTTDIQGNYNINVLPTDTLVFNYLGFNTVEQPVKNREIIDLSLSKDVKSLNEVVVVGYGTMKKSDMTGAVSSIKADEMTLAANANFTQMMQGKASGVQIVQSSAQPGGGTKVLVRGAANNATDNEPLYIIDGFPVSNDNIEQGYVLGKNYPTGSRSPLNSINPNDIESIEILKDASSTAIYGARASNGVVIITTKRGAKGVKVNYEGRFSTQQIIKYFEVLNGAEFMQMYNNHKYDYDAILSNVAPYGPGDADAFRQNYKFKYSEEDITNVGEGTDYFDEVTNTGLIQDQNISIQGGDENTQVFTSFNYFDHKGVLMNSGLKRYAGRFNFDQIISKSIKIGASATGSLINNNNAALGGGVWEKVGILNSAYGFPNIYPVYDSLGNYTVNELYSSNPNPVSFQHLTDYTIEKRWLANAFADIKILEGLYLKTTMGFDDNQSERNIYTPTKDVFLGGGNGSGSRAKNSGNSQLFEITTRYNTNYKENHSIGVLAGYSYQVFKSNGLYGSSEGYFTNLFKENSLQTGEASDEVSSYRSENRLASYFGRVNYSYKGKYVLQFTGRYDGSDKFGENNKYGFFPSASAAWNIGKEAFMMDQSVINNLKLRLGLGQTGNDKIRGSAYAYYGPDGFRYQFDNQLSTGLGKTSLANPELKWETTTEINIGMDFGFWSNRLQGSIDLFSRQISDLLYYQPLQSFQEVDNVYMNIGETKSSGWEFNLKGTVMQNASFIWESYINLSKYKDVWVKRAETSISQLPSYADSEGLLRPVYSYLPGKIFQIGDEQPYTNITYVPGNLVVQDIGRFATDGNGNFLYDENNRRIIENKSDGVINDADVALRGSRDPDLILGFGTNLSYKNFDLNFFFHGMINYWVSNANDEFYTLRSEFIYGGFNRSKDFLDVWTTANPNGTIPATPQTKVPVGYNTLMHQEASFLRLKNLTFAYTFPKKVIGTSLKLYLDAANLLTFTNVENMDPESITYAGPSQYGSNSTGFGAYPSAKTYTFGISINF